MKSFSEFIIERTELIANSGWFVLKIDENNTVMTSAELMKEKKVQIVINNSKAKTINIGKCLHTTLKNEGLKIDTKDKKTRVFLMQVMHTCNCKI
jgi:hypothetical protein